MNFGRRREENMSEREITTLLIFGVAFGVMIIFGLAVQYSLYRSAKSREPQKFPTFWSFVKVDAGL
ncbi:hypothetical protein A2924_04385 [Candidatus Giovannonibacteria bacterium RIFCSPLOWO2_01_FULL_44_16]|uniref:Uncharacterized protein n=2 Tax=Candidatus Giovannoniibacteriota TaxID=1752738 RepID=A0A1F5X524_9BACT|nr:MAG: hypothetical protein A2924_04385 [Candidatus Giovannonibacteria bacterium RIFCSPLOWO2_01_FULL_44_16]